MFARLAVLMGLLLTAPALAAQDTARAAAPGAGRSLAAMPAGNTLPVVDGRLDDPAWASAPVATGFVQRGPEPGAAAPEKTELRVLYSSDALYVSARMYDDPDSVAAQLSRRDMGGTYSDWVFVLLDSDDDNRSAFAFGVNPREVQRDFILAEDGGRDDSWDAVWTARAQFDSLGWTAEFRIPLSQLRYNAGTPNWGVNFRRDVARRTETSYWAPIPPDAAGFVSRFGDLTGLDGVAMSTRLELQPYAVTRLTRAPGDGANPFYSSNEFKTSGGFDFRYGLTSKLTVSGTVKPDFGQVEADPSEVNLTAFETFLPERRPFFVEGANIFNFGLGGGIGQLFYSRRVGTRPRGVVPGDAEFSDMPQNTTILGAVKLSGKTAGGWSVGAMNVVTAREEATYVRQDGSRATAPVEPLTNVGVARVIKDFNRGGSALGAIFTSVHRDIDEDSPLTFLRHSAYAGGVDGRHRFGGGNYEVSGYAVTSLVQGSERAIQSTQRRAGRYFQRPDADHLEYDPELTSLSGSVLNLEVERIGGSNWRWELGGRAVSPGFEVNDAGYQPSADVVSQFGSLEYQQARPGRHFRHWRVQLQEGASWTTGRERLTTSTNLYGTAQLKNFWSVTAVAQRVFQGMSTSELRGGPALVTPGAYVAQASVTSDPRKPVVGTGYGVASLSDDGGRLVALGTAFAVRPSPRVEFSLEPQVNWLGRPAQYLSQTAVEGSTNYYFSRLEQTTASLRARLSYTFSPTLSLQF
ncbi:MAG: carbohydrate binding family 9 domain-containing protein, partial [Gemmatimonadetes bacterium]|nr:carbohydrate binding family 9 domain-containing protein [Gemmatimonadota bacterium]